MKTIPSVTLSTFASMAMLLLWCTTLSAADRSPNVVFILADDLGWSDTTLFGTTKFYKTPHIERLAQRGMTFTHAYASSPLCSPTRASILTGQSPARTDITAPTCHLPLVALKASPGSGAPPTSPSILPRSATRLQTEHYTLAEMFKDNGYATGHFGKWHLGPTPYSPLQHGFDVDIPHFAGPGPAGSYVAPWKYPDFDPQTPNEHIEDRMANEAVAFMQAHRDEPFFLNYWMFSVHAPFDAKPKLIEQYRNKVVPSDLQRSPTYAAMIESMDDAVGALIDELDRLELTDNTIIVFASDNGGNMYNEVDGTSATSNAPLRGGKATMYEGGVRGPAIVAYPDSIKAGSRSDEVIQSSDFYPTLLEMLSIDSKSDQVFDGISIVPALQGKSLDRDAIFTYFPHSPHIPEWLPPAVSVHQNDWKLIRIFFGGNDGAHRYKLFNLDEDLGESNNLADQFPQRVQSMDALIEEFLIETDAVRPTLNPRFDPSTYKPEREGKAALKGGRGNPAKKPKPRSGKPVAGWRPEGGCSIALKNGAMVVTSNSKDPHVSHTMASAVTASKLTLRFTMTSNSSGTGQIFWRQQGVKPAFIAIRSTEFDVRHDGQPHEYEIDLPTEGPILGLRIDPSRDTGKIEIKDLRLTSEGNTTVRQWSFGSAK